MNVQAKVALDKEKHPERFCPVKRCLWKVMQLDHGKQTYSLRADCLTGYCPRHKRLAQDIPGVAVQESF